MSESKENYPFHDEPTRDSLEDETGAFVVSSDRSNFDVPIQIGDYKILDRVGAGGMGQVFLAEHTRMQRIVALKMLPIDRMKDPKAIERFYEEIRAASRLLHPNIVTAFDAGESVGVHYLAMEYIDGSTLLELVAKEGPMPVAKAASIIRQAATGLLHAHRSGITHRDVKPSNLMQSVDGTVKVLDLGLAQVSSSNLMQREAEKKQKGAGEVKRKLVGTLTYMSPEQLENSDSADARSDIYSLGATLFFLLTGRPPFAGEQVDQVYGHRHGDIPDLMQSRNDVDLRLTNIFRRMLAKSPGERYASLDEVIDDLADYSVSSESPLWMAEFSQHSKQPTGNVAAPTPTQPTARVYAIDLGMHYSAAAESTPEGYVKPMLSGENKASVFRMALSANENQGISYGTHAMERREDDPQHLFHCLPLYIGKETVDRELNGRQCPPEVLLALLIKRITGNAWAGRTPPRSTAITVPSSYDQLHRKSILLAGRLAGLTSIRLVDRSLAAVKSTFLLSDDETLNEDDLDSVKPKDEPILFLGLTGQALEVAILRRNSGQLHQLATGGHWHTGSLSWVHRLVDYAAKLFKEHHQFDPKKKSKSAAALQVACEKALNAMLLLPTVTVEVLNGKKAVSVPVNRQQWLDECEDLISHLETVVDQVSEKCGIKLSSIHGLVVHGAVLQIPSVRKRLLRKLDSVVSIQSVDRNDVAKGAAACLDAELPGRGMLRQPPHGISSQTIGIVVEDVRRRRRILAIIPSGTSLPARTNRKLRVGRDQEDMTLSLVESSGVGGQSWHALGRYEFKIENPNYRSRTIGFEIDVDGILQVRAQHPGKTGSVKLASLPESPLTETAIADWKQWIDKLT
ncbi:Hsp70 family protein [Rhodopirellula sp.]|nr:Hsp70 family protein [Rhodopirellula sp.]MDB4679293.1 Hsp70 family protein [Rhodopirellula sp.]